MPSEIEKLLRVDLSNYAQQRQKKKSLHAMIPKINTEHKKVMDFDLSLNSRVEAPELWGLDYATFGRMEFIDNLTIQTSLFSRGRSVYPYSEWKDPQDSMVGRWISHELLIKDTSSYFLDISPQILSKLAARQRIALGR